MKLESLLTLIDKVSESKLDSFAFEDEAVRVSMKKKKEKVVVTEAVGFSPAVNTGMGNTATVQAGPSVAADEQEDAVPAGNQVKAPLVGTFYNASSPDAEPFVKVGDTVSKGQVLGIIEAMKLMNEIECEYDGVVAAILPKNEQMVEYGQPLFIIR